MFLLLLLEAWAGEGGLKACGNATVAMRMRVGACGGICGVPSHMGSPAGFPRDGCCMHTWQQVGACRVMLHIT